MHTTIPRITRELPKIAGRISQTPHFKGTLSALATGLNPHNTDGGIQSRYQAVADGQREASIDGNQGKAYERLIAKIEENSSRNTKAGNQQRNEETKGSGAKENQGGSEENTGSNKKNFWEFDYDEFLKISSSLGLTATIVYCIKNKHNLPSDIQYDHFVKSVSETIEKNNIVKTEQETYDTIIGAFSLMSAGQGTVSDIRGLTSPILPFSGYCPLMAKGALAITSTLSTADIAIVCGTVGVDTLFKKEYYSKLSAEDKEEYTRHFSNIMKHLKHELENDTLKVGFRAQNVALNKFAKGNPYNTPFLKWLNERGFLSGKGALQYLHVSSATGAVVSDHSAKDTRDTKEALKNYMDTTKKLMEKYRDKQINEQPKGIPQRNTMICQRDHSSN